MATALQSETPPSIPARTSRLHQIDALRGLAALLVIVAHASSSFASYALASGHSDLLYTLSQCIDTGRIGVMIFFIVSGFVVANTLHAPGANLRTFAIRRLLRLYPLFWFSMVVIISILKGKNELVTGAMDWKTIGANITMLPTLLNFDPLIIIYWTLETEIVFYAVASIVFRYGCLFQPKRLLALIFFLIAIFASMMFGIFPAPNSLAWKSLTLNLAFMFWGALFHATFSTHEANSQTNQTRYWLAWGAIIILSPSAYTLLRFIAKGSADDLRWAVAYPSALLIFSALYFVNGGWIRMASRLGLISYSLYLLHPAAITMVGWLIESHLFMREIAYLPVMTLAAIGSAIALSWLTYAWIEKPFISLSRKLTVRPALPTATAQSNPASY